MAIKIYGNEIVFPDESKQTTAFTGKVEDVYTKEQIDAQQKIQDDAIIENNDDIARQQIEISNQQTSIDKNTGDIDTEADRITANTTEIATKVDEAPDDGATYGRTNKTWTSIGGSAGIPDAPVDNVLYGRKNGEWDPVADASDIYTKAQTNDLLDEKADKATTYTKAEVNASQATQDDAIANNTIAINANTDAIAALPAPVDAYTKSESDAIDNAQNTEIQANTDAIAALPTPVDTYTKSEIDTQQGLQDDAITANENNITTNSSDIAKNTADILTNNGNIATNSSNIASNTIKTENNALAIGELSEEVSTNTTNISTNTGNISTNTGNISSNTSAIGTLSGQVGQNSENIAELQDSIFFTSAYSADYPEAPNRDPGDGNMYLQNVALFTYSYAEATQIFASKTDEAGNVRQFTAIKPGDSIVLNEVQSPNYGRYELVSIEDVTGDYVVMNVTPMLGQGTVITGAKVAFQAFPKPGTDNIWTESVNDVYFTNNNNGFYVNTSQSNSVNLIGYNGTDFNDIWLRGVNTPNTGVGALTDGRIMMPDVANTSTGEAPNLVIDDDGQIIKSTVIAYSRKEVEGLVNAKDEIIDKLTERLDALEKRVK